VVCVSPPVDGDPLPYFPVKVSVQEPCAAALDDTTVIVEVRVPPTVTELGLIEQVVCGAGSEQVSATLPLNPPNELIVTVKVAVCPDEMVSVGGPTENEKSPTLRAPAPLAVAELALKLLSPG
jgi:hypothetical protein